MILNVNAPTKDKSGDFEDNFYEELECVFSSQSTTIRNEFT